MKKGISPLIATVLVIGFTIALALVIFTWGKAFTQSLTEETGEKAQSQLACLQTNLISFEVKKACYQGNSVTFTLENKGEATINKVSLRFTGLEDDQIDVRELELGLVAFLHDVAMQELPGVADSDEQRKAVVGNEVIKNYIKSGLQILRQIPFLPAVILDVCRQYHEHYHGGGSGLVHEYAQIMRMADSFETLTHYRPNRVTKTAQSALRELIESADTDFARKVLKILIKQVGIYPVGTFVLLNTQEIAEVFKNNENFPLRPVINVLQVSEDKLSLLRTVNLLTTPSLYVTGTLTREDALARIKPESRPENI